MKNLFIKPNQQFQQMRVTEVTKRDHVVDNIQKSSGQLQDIQMQMATGRRLNKTSDDPIGAARSQDIVTTISSQKQLLRTLWTMLPGFNTQSRRFPT